MTDGARGELSQRHVFGLGQAGKGLRSAGRDAAHRVFGERGYGEARVHAGVGRDDGPVTDEQVSVAEHALVAVNLFAGNQYWFSAAAKAKKISVEVYDEGGKPMVTEPYNSGDKAAAGFSPTSSGQYFISLGLLEGEPTTFCLVYSYK